MKRSYDIAVVGSGFAGSLIAMIAARLGLSVVLLEKGKHPRVVIGESSTPLSNLLLEGLADRYDLPMLKPLTKWGAWQQTYPHLACGLKRGFSFLHHVAGDLQHHGRSLIAASPTDTIADTHWFRADFDHFLVQQSQQLGVDYIDEVDIHQANFDNHRWRLSTRSSGQNHTIEARFLLDATGPRGFLHRTLHLAETALSCPATCALYTHFSDVNRLDTLPGLAPTTSPYPMDDAALHHVFDGGWIWVLRFNNGLTSAGVAATKPLADRFGLSVKESGWNRLIESFPLVKEQFAKAKAERPFTFIPHLSFRSASIAGDNWAMLPSAAGFVDPILSTGLPLTLLGVERIAHILERHWGSASLPTALVRYAKQTDNELVATSSLVAALYANMDDFATFHCLSLLYFAAASYSETARRLTKPELANSFLLHEHSTFGRELRRITALAQTSLKPKGKQQLQEKIYRLIDDFDVAGLGKRPTDHCYPVLAEDLFTSAHKLGASKTDMQALLRRAGFYAPITL